MNESHISSQRLNLDPCPIHSSEGLSDIFAKTSKHKTPINIQDLRPISNAYGNWTNKNLPKTLNEIFKIFDDKNLKHGKCSKYLNSNEYYNLIYSKLFNNVSVTKYDYKIYLLPSCEKWGNLSTLERSNILKMIKDTICEIVPENKEIIITKTDTLILKVELDNKTNLKFTVSIVEK